MNAVALAFALISLPTLLLGVLMQSAQRVDLISGFDLARVRDRDALARFVAFRLYAIGATMLAAGACIALVDDAKLDVPLSIGAAITVNAIVISLVAGLRRRARAEP